MRLGGPLKEKCITIILGPFESKVFSHYNCCWGSLLKQSSLLIHCSCYWAPFESKVGYFAHYSCKGGARGKCLACHHLNTPLYISLTMILYEDTKPIEPVLLHPICVLSHLMFASKHCNLKLSVYYSTHWSCWWVYRFKKHRYNAIFHNNLDTQVD